MLRRLGAFVAAATLAGAGLVACGHGQACAATAESPAAEAFVSAQAAAGAVFAPERGGTGGGTSGGTGGTHSGSTGTKSGSTSTKSGSTTGRSGGTKSTAPSNSGTHSSTSPSNSGTHTPSKSFTPKSGTSFSSGGSSYPSSYGKSYTYHSPSGETHVFVIHPHSYYHTGGFHDPFDPYDWTNFYNPASPYYGVHVHC